VRHQDFQASFVFVSFAIKAAKAQHSEQLALGKTLDVVLIFWSGLKLDV
jgi:hypothetical protein